MADEYYLIKGETLTAIADAIRENSNVGTAPMTPYQMVSGIENVYDAGYDDGYADGQSEGGTDLEALGVLCEWMVTTDSQSSPLVTIVNYHPSYYLHCDVWYSVEGETYPLVVPPDDSDSVVFVGEFSGQEQIDIMSVRWKASAE